MRKPVKNTAPKRRAPPKPTRPTDPNRAAHAMLAEHMARVQEEQPLDFETAYKAHMAKLGAKGGRVGGKRRLETLTQDERSAIASKAARAMWAKRKRTKGR